MFEIISELASEALLKTGLYKTFLVTSIEICCPYLVTHHIKFQTFLKQDRVSNRIQLDAHQLPVSYTHLDVYKRQPP